MLAKLASYTLVGIDALPIEVEVDVSPTSVPRLVLVGLAETAVKESTHRVERALVNSGYHRVFDRIVINLAPADLKQGCRRVRPADCPGTAGRQRTTGGRAQGPLCRGR
jgi:magnesium chelatase family protein